MSPNLVLMTTSEVAELFRVHPATVARWVRDGRLASVTLPAGRIRFRREDVEALVNGSAEPAAVA